MVYERTLKSMAQLLEELRGLEVDAGVRAHGKYEGRQSLVFVTRNSGDYSLWIRDASPSSKDPGSFRRFKDHRDLGKFLAGVLDRPLRAYIY